MHAHNVTIEFLKTINSIILFEEKMGEKNFKKNLLCVFVFFFKDVKKTEQNN